MEHTDYVYSEEMLRHAAVGLQPNAAIMQAYPAERLGIVLLGNEFAYGAATPITPAVPRDAIAYLAASLDW